MPWIKQKQLTGHTGAIFSSAFDGKYLYTGSADKFVARWNLQEGKQDDFSIKFEQSIFSMAIVNEIYLIVGLANGALHIFDLEQRIEKHFFSQHTKAIFSIAVNPLRNQLYVGDADGNLSIWDAKTFQLQIYLPLDAGKIRDISVNSDGSKFAIACQDGTFRIFETDFFNEIETNNAHKGGTTSVLFHPQNDSILITGGKDALLTSWNLVYPEQIESIPAHNYAIYAIIPVLNGTAFLTASRDKTIKVWDDRLNFLQRLDFKSGGHRHSVNKLKILDDRTIVSVSDDAKIIVWEFIDAIR